MNVASLVDSTLIQRRLYDIMQNNPEELTAIYKDLIAQELVENDKVHTTLYGCYGYAATLMMLIPAITQPLASVLCRRLPELGRKAPRKN